MKLLAREVADRVPHAVLLRDEARERRFVVVAPAVLLEAQRHRLQIGRAALLRQRDDRGGVDARGEERADRHVGDHVIAHRLEHGVVQFVNVEFRA